jgi:hypothetical protein
VPLPTARPVVAAADKARDKNLKSVPSGAFALASTDSRPVDLSPPSPSAMAATDDVFTARGIWEGPQGRPEPPSAIPEQEQEPVEIADASALPALGPARARAGRRAADLEITGIVSPRQGSRGGDDRVPADVALAYAAHNDGTIAPAAPQAAPMGNTVAREATPSAPLDAAGLSTFIKKTIARAASPRAVASTPGPTSSASKHTFVPAIGDTYADPWLRAMVLAPNLLNYLTITAFAAPDPLSLRPLMVKPESIVVMTFSNDPHLGMTSDRFSGSAIVFVSTVTFAGRTAMLR